MSNGRIIFGIILIAIGGLFLLDKLNLFFYFDFSDFWPVILIVIGIILIVRHNRRQQPQTDCDPQTVSGTGYRKYSTVFNDNNFAPKGVEVDGLKFSTVFGDNSINLAEAKLKPGINRIDISGVFGDQTVIIPSAMEVSAFGSSTFGDLYILGQTAGGISSSLQHQTEGYESAESKIHIWASVTFGDIKIYRA